jgi:hypothetical protein
MKYAGAMPSTAASLLRGAVSTSIVGIPTGAIQFTIFPWMRRSLRKSLQPTTPAGEVSFINVIKIKTDIAEIDNETNVLSLPHISLQIELDNLILHSENSPE